MAIVFREMVDRWTSFLKEIEGVSIESSHKPEHVNSQETIKEVAIDSNVTKKVIITVKK